MTKQDKIWIALLEVGAKLGCHQMPSRSFTFRQYQFPLCARCCGVVLSSFVALPLFFMRRISVVSALVLSGIMFLDWLLQFLHILPSTNPRRFVTGLLGGFGFSTLQFYAYQFLFSLLSSKTRKDTSFSKNNRLLT